MARQRQRHRINPGLVALSASAVAAVYLTGYVRTAPADAALGPAPVAIAAEMTQKSPEVTPHVTPGGMPSTLSFETEGWHDGTYTGTASSRRGDLWVSVDVRGGRIANVSITHSTMQYPLRDLGVLSLQVVERQTSLVDIVSRATYSSQAFRTAVSQALAKAA